MLILNFSHPITDEQQAQISEMTGQPISEVRAIPAQFDNFKPFAEQISRLVDAAGLAPKEWQERQVLINPPSYNFAAMTLLAELHGRMGYFPSILRVRPVRGEDGKLVTPPRYEIAEIINLQNVREEARLSRQDRE